MPTSYAFAVTVTAAVAVVVIAKLTRSHLQRSSASESLRGSLAGGTFPVMTPTNTVATRREKRIRRRDVHAGERWIHFSRLEIYPMIKVDPNQLSDVHQVMLSRYPHY